MRNALRTGQWTFWLVVFLLPLAGGSPPARAATFPDQPLAARACPCVLCAVSARLSPAADESRLQRRRGASRASSRGLRTLASDRVAERGFLVGKGQILIPVAALALSSRSRI